VTWGWAESGPYGVRNAIGGTSLRVPRGQTDAVRISVIADVAWGKERKNELANGYGVRCRCVLFFDAFSFLVLSWSLFL